MDNELVITVNIGGRSYKLRIKHEEEELVRRASKEIENCSKEYAQAYAYRDTQDLLAMVALQQTLSALQLGESADYQENEVHNKLKEIDQILSEA